MTIAAITFDNIFSGLIGAVIGVASAWLLSWRSGIWLASSRVRSLLLSVGYRLYHDGNVVEILTSHYNALLDALLDLSGRECPWRRRRILSLGYKLLGHDSTSRARHSHKFPDYNESMKTVEDLLTYIGYGDGYLR